ncbi:MAG: hypothetical protein FWD34_05655 [Oscillospiraceae bacterium]|nr:hypothetical protein [Oscillospiraceae bacterium]
MNVNLGVQNTYNHTQSAVKFTQTHSAFATEFSSAVAAKNNSAFTPTTSHMWVQPCANIRASGMRPTNFSRSDPNIMEIPIGQGDMLGLMAKIKETIENGECFTTALQAQRDKHICPETGAQTRQYGKGFCSEEVGNVAYDSIWIDITTGEIKWFQPMQPMVMGFNVESDEEAIRQLATSLATFLRYTVFAQDDDCPEMVERILAEINDKQAGICMERFYRTDIMDGGTAPVEDEEEEEHEKIELIDELIAAIAKHQEQLSANSKYKYYEVTA